MIDALQAAARGRLSYTTRFNSKEINKFSFNLAKAPAQLKERWAMLKKSRDRGQEAYDFVSSMIKVAHGNYDGVLVTCEGIKTKEKRQDVKEEWLSYAEMETKEGAEALKAMIEYRTITMRPHPALVDTPIEYPKNQQFLNVSEVKRQRRTEQDL